MIEEIERVARDAGCTELQVWTLLELARGSTPREIADERGVLERGIWATRAAALRKIDAGPRAMTNRQAQAKALRDAGHSWRYIGRAMGIDHKAVVSLCDRAERNRGRSV